ncbi:MAG: Aldo/keto reductase [Pseudolabrys sp.]|jgi:aryl-alcohol dehydrogenase (NADP+)|nr:Aldo/keto reductase [Pseudolabrys sp.]
MQYRTLGTSGLKVSPLCLGTMMFGGATDETVAGKIVARARDQGVNFIDTADVYNGGKAEEVTGRAIGNRRDDWVVATKLGNRMGEGANRGGLSRKWVIQAAEDSLRRLGTDYIDIYYLHKEDHDTPLAETVRAMGDLIRQGKIRYFGVSNYRAWRIAEICNLCDRMGIDRPAASQPYYHALYRVAEVEHLPACKNYGLGVVSYSPLARGVLTGKYRPGADAPQDTRAGRADKRMLQTEFRTETLEAAQKVKAYAEKRGMTPNHFAVAWVLNNTLIDGVIAGPRTEAHWDDYVKALDYTFTKDDEDFIDGLVVTGHPAAPGYNDPAYPIEGRVPRTG